MSNPGSPLALKLPNTCVCVWWKAMLVQQHAAKLEMFCYVCFIIKSCSRYMLTSLPSARYITNLRENAEEGTKLLFEGGLDRVEDLDKVFIH